MALLARFEGYFPGFSKLIRDQPDQPDLGRAQGPHRATAPARCACARPTRATCRWSTSTTSRKAATRGGEDLRAVVQAIRFVRRLTAPLIDKRLDRRGARARRRGAQSDEALADYVRDTAWGHHASCSCAIGAARRRAACSTAPFAVHGVPRLRVVDASVFPRIPGFFVASAVYMVAEKAADAILRDAARTPLSAN